jgi:hypothetical protein
VFAEHLERAFRPNEEKNFVTSRRIPKTQINRLPPIRSKEITANVDPKKSLGFDQLTGEILRQLPKKAIVNLTYLYNAAFGLKCVPSYWKTAEVIIIQKPGKSASKATSYTPISYYQYFKIFQKKLLLKRLKPMLEEKQIFPTNQFGFRNNLSTIHQVHRMTTTAVQTTEEKKSVPLSTWTWPKHLIKFGMKESFTKLSISCQQNTADC